MRIENYISDLLYRYECVIVPGFGAFLTHKKSSSVHHSTNAFYPPSKIISFNEQLNTNDGLLPRYIASVENISFEQALDKLEQLVDFWKSQLLKGEEINLKNIGAFKYTPEAKIQFEPSYHLNYYTPSFGLGSFVAPLISREVLKEEVEEIEEKIPVLFTPEKRRRKPYLRYAAIALIAISLGTTGFIFFQQYKNEQLQLAEEEAVEKVEQTIQRATFFDAEPVLLPSVKLKVTKEFAKYHIIAGAFRIEANAIKKVKQLQNKGFEAQQIGVNRYGLHQVSYGGFNDVSNALQFLREVRNNESSEAWLFKADTE